MLKLKGITKIYDVADEKVVALGGVDIEFRKSEFVSVLGPSGCGKTTLLNIIGGLDKYTSGDMEIAGISTADYNDRDWDSYRNHSIGFVFQNYNLIPHLNVLTNVELALTLVGEDKETRTAKALRALEKVGLRNKAYKKPNQLSGGQMQRVAIARAIINDPEIILADEPTGALDSETSVQVMEILKEISLTRLVIMVTHNGELAKAYSTRIIRLFDGKVVGDTNPYSYEKEAAFVSESADSGGYAEALRIVNGKFQEDTGEITDEEIAASVKAYSFSEGKARLAVFAVGSGKIITPLTARVKKLYKGGFIERKVISGSVLSHTLKAFGITRSTKRIEEQKQKYENKPAMRMFTAFLLSFTNLLTKKFRTFLTALAGSIGILGIALVLALYAGLNNYIVRQEVALSSYPISITKSASDYEAMVSTVISSLDGLDGKYDRNKVYVYKLVQQLLANQSSENVFDSEMIAAIKKIDPSLYYDIYENYGLNFNVVKKIDRGTKILNFVTTTSMYYMSINTNSYWAQLPTEELVLEQYELLAGHYPRNKNELVLILDGKNQISDINLFFNGLNLEGVSLNYQTTDSDDLVMNVSDFVSDTGDLGKFRLVPNDNYYIEDTFYKNETQSPSGTINAINNEIRNRVGSGYTMTFFRGDATDDSSSFIYTNCMRGAETLSISGVIKLRDDVSVGVLGTKSIGYTKELTEYVLETSFASNVVQRRYNSLPDEVKNSDVELSKNLKGFGYSSVPDSISIYCKNYDSKTAVKNALRDISETRKANGKSGIVYSDLMSVVLSVVQQFINIITGSLLALTAISLIVSALMIGIVTYVSVLERTREIGVLRALGARKIDISRIFNAETIVIGFVSGLLGVIITYLVSWPLAAILTSVTGIGGLVALPWYYAALLVLLSTVLTLIAGLIPANIAKSKDPVKALRAE